MSTPTSPRKVVFSVLGAFVVCLIAVNWYTSTDFSKQGKSTKSSANSTKSQPKKSPAPVKPTKSAQTLSITPAPSLESKSLVKITTAPTPSSSAARRTLPTTTDSLIGRYLAQGIDQSALDAIVLGQSPGPSDLHNAQALRFSVAKMTQNVTFNFSETARRIFGRFSARGSDINHVLVALTDDIGGRQTHVVPVTRVSDQHVFALHKLPKKLTQGHYAVEVYRLDGKLPLEAHGLLEVGT